MKRIFDITRPLSADLDVLSDRSRGDLISCARIGVDGDAGTHLLAPAAVSDEGAAIDELALERLVGPCLIVDAPGGALPGPISGAAERLFFRTRTGDASAIGLADSVIPALLMSGVRLVGIDSDRIDHLGAVEQPIRRELLKAGIPVVLGLDFGDLPPGWYELACLPLPIHAPSAPARVLLTLP